MVLARGTGRTKRMANKTHLKILRKGVKAWNAWRRANPDSRANLFKANLRRADLTGAGLYGANLRGANLRRADLRDAHLVRVYLIEAYLRGADLREAKLGRAKLRGACLEGAQLVGTHLANADLTGCRIYGISAWDLNLDGVKQADLIITRDDQPEITVDNLKVAQFVYLLLNNEKIRDVIDTVGRKGCCYWAASPVVGLTCLSNSVTNCGNEISFQWCSTLTRPRPKTSPKRSGYSSASPAL
jgi:hypothetical protein